MDLFGKMIDIYWSLLFWTPNLKHLDVINLKIVGCPSYGS